MACKHVLPVTVFSAFLFVVTATCGYESCHPTHADKLNVHLVPHTHDDVGWLKTADEYFYGANNSIQHAGVQYILDSVVTQLAKDPGRRFIYVEIAFFERWWREQDDATRSMVRQFVNDGRLEFINGGWSMNDEACTHYNAIIDQMTEGLRFLVNTFGQCAVPRVAWHIDPFGHSREQASLIAQMGFDSFFFARLDYSEKLLFINHRRMEQIWHSNANLGSPADLFYGATYSGYGPPKGFCFDRGCSDPPIQDDTNLFDYNVDERVAALVKKAKEQAAFYKTNHIMFTMGSDFQWENANAWYKNLDKLIKYVNAKEEETGVHLLYSTPSCYTYGLNQANETWNTTSADFMPYADSPHAFWTGYYTSRPAVKGYVRKSNNLLQVCKQLEALTGKERLRGSQGSTDRLKQAMGVAQHHDAVTGTEKQHVADDYSKRLHIGRVDCQTLISDAITSDITKTKPRPKATGTPEHCDYLNISICATTESQTSFTVVVYNPLARTNTLPVRVPVNHASYKVLGPNGTVVSQVQSVTAATKSVRRGRGNATMELIFMATAPPIGYSTYQVSSTMRGGLKGPSGSYVSATTTSSTAGADVSISNGLLSLAFDGSTGLLKSISDLSSNNTVAVNQSFYWYEGSEGSKTASQASGAYIFRPNSSSPHSLFDGKSVQLKKVSGGVFQEIQQQFTPWLSQVIRLYYGVPAAEFTWTVGPIPIADNTSKEIITRFDTNIASNKTFYTDSNGRQVMKRILNHREDFPYINTEPVAGNYYPINSQIFIKDAKSQFTVLTDRSEGGSSLKNGSLEIMIHRRLLVDDHRGVGEALNETGQFGDGLMVRGSHFVSLSTPTDAPYIERTLGEEIYMTPYYYVTSGLQTVVNTSLVSRALPANVHLLTLELVSPDVVLLRLEHQFEVGEDAAYSTNVTVSLKDFFQPFSVLAVQELTLGANRLLRGATRLQWRTLGSATTTPQPFKYNTVTAPNFNVRLAPMDIRTFNVTIIRQ